MAVTLRVGRHSCSLWRLRQAYLDGKLLNHISRGGERVVRLLERPFAPLSGSMRNIQPTRHLSSSSAAAGNRSPAPGYPEIPLVGVLCRTWQILQSSPRNYTEAPDNNANTYYGDPRLLTLVWNDL